ncbi:HAD family hydrolase [Marinicrinis sediminis]|uniref:HAD family hydrolase n=1 Tax=Marinicrinis sediminis TaxID=1652465 RepID=A0ABW5RAL5_9BACL
MYQHYIFDLYGTLFDIETYEEDLKVWEELSIYLSYYGFFYTPVQLRLKIEQHKQLQLADRSELFTHPEYEMEHCFQQLTNEHGESIDADLAESCTKLFRSMTMHRLQLYEGVMDMLETLKKRGKSIYLLSNGQRHFIEPELKLLGIADLFHDIAISSVEGSCKPDRAFFETLLQRNQIEVHEAIMIGNDATTDIAGAQGIGMDACYIHSNSSPDVSKEEVTCKHQIWDGRIEQILELEV